LAHLDDRRATTPIPADRRRGPLDYPALTANWLAVGRLKGSFLGQAALAPSPGPSYPVIPCFRRYAT